MFRRWGWSFRDFEEIDLFSDRYDTNAQTLSQAIRAAATEEPDADGSVLFGQMKGTVVGLRYYTGVVNRGEMVGLVRQPQNPYDRNAVMVANVYGHQVGHIKKELAAAMAQIMDNNLAKVEGVVYSGTNNAFSMPVTLSFWGKEENKENVTKALARRGFRLETSVGSGSGSGGNFSFFLQLKNAFDNLFEGLMESKDGEKEAADAVSTPLLPHQKQALSWMCARENKSSLPPFWEKRGELYYNSLTCFSSKEVPERVRGGILADDMGLRSILTHFSRVFSGGDPTIPDIPEDPSATATLIVCPLSVLSNWLDQFEQHVSVNVKLNVYLYYGSERNRSEKFLSSQDVVITTYNVLSADFGNKSPLHKINWLRVVLDEGHFIRNPNAQMSKAVLELKASRRWILSGTPIQNSVKDLWTLLAFLRLKPFDVREWWNRVIQRPVTQGDRTGLQNLQTLVKCVTLRRTKTSEVNGRPLVVLPEKAVFVEQVELSPEERAEYELANSEGQKTIRRYVAEGSVLKNYADVLAILMRLRQHCCHPDLPTKSSSDSSSDATPAELRQRLIEKLRLVLVSGSDEECSVCLDSVRFPVITHCAHVYCRPCIAKVISTQEERARCPLCRSDIRQNELVEVPEEEDTGGNTKQWRTSSKVQALMGNLLRLRLNDQSIKCLVVSQFTRFLTVLETPLREEGFSFVRLDGTMTQKRRAQVIQDFQSSSSDGPSIMLLSLKAGGVGLNLTAASHVFLMDPAWNPATEEQCIDRCHRLGQKKKVVVTKFIVKDSVEENMVKIQKKKQDLVEKAFGASSNSKKSSRIDDIKTLMEITI
uniref:Uncharacterized protein n=1 Tax=Periophthalmus magnuspinnatus TaxID=409849 RepID=A0A3B4ASI4_9GOBI